MNYIIYNGKIRAVKNIIKYSYSFKSDNNKRIENITGERYVLNIEDFNNVFHNLEFEISKPENENISISVEDVDCSDVVAFDGIEAVSEDEAENIIKNFTLEEQLLEARFELDSLKLGLDEQWGEVRI